MTMSELVQKIESHAPGSMIPRDWLLEELSKATGEIVGTATWVDSVRASEITGEPVEWLRSRAMKWRGQPNPLIRVTKNDPDKQRSLWLYCEEDCWAYRRAHSHAELEVDIGADPDDDDAIASAISARATAHL